MTFLAGLPKTGMIVPEMGKPARPIRSTGLAGALFTPVQQRVLALLFGQPQRRFQSAELIRMAGSGTGAAHRQLQRLAASGLVNVTTEGSQKYYQANPHSPIYPELHGLVVKTVAVIEPLRSALKPLAARIDVAFVFGSMAKKSDRAGSDLDLLIVTDSVTYPEAYEALQPVEETLARTINPLVMTRAEWKRKRGAADSFAKRIGSQPKLFLIGDENALG